MALRTFAGEESNKELSSSSLPESAEKFFYLTFSCFDIAIYS